jgi:hypothetical protein
MFMSKNYPRLLDMIIGFKFDFMEFFVVIVFDHTIANFLASRDGFFGRWAALRSDILNNWNFINK